MAAPEYSCALPAPPLDHHLERFVRLVQPHLRRLQRLVGSLLVLDLADGYIQRLQEFLMTLRIGAATFSWNVTSRAAHGF